MADTYINITARRADGSKLSDNDFNDFKKFFVSNLSQSATCIYSPRLNVDRLMMYGEFELYGFFEKDEIKPFSETHPHLQIEVISEFKYYDQKTRFLYHGSIAEEINEVRYFPQPKLIDWPWQ